MDLRTEIVQNRYRAAFLQQASHKVRTDEAGATGYKNIHSGPNFGATVRTAGRAEKL